MPSSVTLPAGLVPVRSLTTNEILAANRTASVRVDMLTRTEALLGPLPGEINGAVDWTANAAVKGAGSLTAVDTGAEVDWLNWRFRPVITVDGLPPQPLGVFVAAEAPEAHDDTGMSWSVKLLDKTSLLDTDGIEVSYALASGAVVTTEVAALIATTGETNVAITPSAAVLPGPLVWEVGTSKLQIVNDLLDIIGYGSLYADLNGQLRAEPYTRPADRPMLWEFIDGPSSIYDPRFVRDVDLYVPNRVIAIGQGDGVNPALTSVQTNTNPDSPYSTVSRGRVFVKRYTGVEAADQAALDLYALRCLIDATAPGASAEVSHAFVPGLVASSVVRWRRVTANIDAPHTVSKIKVPFDPTELCTSTLQEVIDL